MKRIISLLLTAVLILSGFSVAFAQSTDRQAAIERVRSLGVMTGYEDGSFGEESLITRAEFAAVVIRFMGADSTIVPVEDTGYTDVPASHWASGYIAAATAMGIVNGYENATFRPENFVTFYEAVKMMVCVLGYSMPAENKGGYPTGYTLVAGELGMLNFSYDTKDSYMNRGAIAELIENSLSAEVMMMTSMNPDGTYALGKGATAMQVFFDSEIRTGLVTSTELDSLRGRDLSEHFVEINDKLYRTKLDCTSFLGESVRYIVSVVDSEEWVIYLAPNPAQRRLLIEADDILQAEGFFTSNGKIVYLNASEKSKTVTFLSNVNIIWNHKLLKYEEVGLVDFLREADTYECIDTDQDGEYDLIKILAYEDERVKKIYTDEEALLAVTQSGQAIRYEETDEDVRVAVIFDGQMLPFSQISENDVISVAKSLDGTSFELIVSRASVEGSVEELQADGYERILKIAGKEYPVSDTLIRKNKVPQLNDSGTFLLNFRGEVAYFNGGENTAEKYAFLTAVQSPTDLNGDYKVKVLESDNKFSVYPLARKVQFSNQGTESTVDAAAIVSYFARTPVYYDKRTAETQIIRYRLNADGELRYLATAKQTADTDAFSLAAPNRKYFYSNSLFNQQWKVTENTVVFCIPATKEGEEFTRYSSGAASKYFAAGNTYQTELYDVDENGEIGAIHYRLTGQERYLTYTVDFASGKVMIVDKLVNRVGEDGESRWLLSGICNNNYTSVYVSDEFLQDADNKKQLSFGNVIQYTTNSKMTNAAHYEDQPEELVKSVLWCDFQNTAQKRLWNRTNIEQKSPKITTVYGKVISIDNTKIRIATPDSALEEFCDVFVEDTQPVVTISGGTIDVGTFYDIQPGKKIFVRMRYDKIKDVVICNE